MGKTILEMIDIKKSFSGIYALSGINFSLEMGVRNRNYYGNCRRKWSG